MNYYKQNLEFLEKNAVQLWKTVKNEEPVYSVELHKTSMNWVYQIGYNGKHCFANSIYNIDREMEDMFKNVNSDAEALVILGIGNGEVFKYIKRNFNNLKSIFVVEPFLDVFKKFLNEQSLEKVFQEQGLISLIVNKDETVSSNILIDIFMNNQYQNIEVIALSSYASLVKTYYHTLKERILRSVRSRLMNFATLDKTKYNWLNNGLQNMRHEHIRQEEIKDLLKGKPGVIVAAGPSLNKQLHMLEELKKKAVIIGASSAMSILNSHNITPHFRMAIDGYPDEKIYNDAFYKNSKDIPILYAGQAYEEILPKYEGKKLFMLLPTDNLGRYIAEKMENPLSFISSGSSVVLSAFSFLYESGCDPIIFLGQDMCFYEDEVYASGIDSIKADYFAKPAWLEMKDIYGNDVYTVRNYLQIKYDYEGLLKDHLDRRIINATEGGLGIDGTEVMTLKEVLNDVLVEELDLDINGEIEKIETNHCGYNKELKVILGIMLEEINEILEINSDMLKSLKKVTKNREKELKTSRLSDDLDYINRVISRELLDNAFFDKVVKGSIMVNSIALKNKYKKSDENELIENLELSEKYLYGIITEIEIFSTVAKDWTEELLEQIADKDELMSHKQ